MRSVSSKGSKLSSCGQRRLLSDWADAKADLRLRWAHMPFCWFCRALAHFIVIILALDFMMIFKGLFDLLISYYLGKVRSNILGKNTSILRKIFFKYLPFSNTTKAGRIHEACVQGHRSLY